MIFSDLSSELKVILNEVMKIDDSTKEIPIFEREKVETIFWKLIEFDKKTGKKLSDELSRFVSSLGRSQDQLLVSAEIKRPAARITETDIPLIIALSQTESIFHRKLGQLESSPKEIIPLLLFSAIRYGGLLDKNCIDQFFQKIKQGIPPNVIDKTAWYSFRHESTANVIWLPDPLTIALITKWLRITKLNETTSPSMKWSSWLSYINSLLEQNNPISSKWLQNSFLSACSVRLSMEIAPAFVDIANGTTPTCAFHGHTWLRLLTGKAPPLAKNQNQQLFKREASNSVGLSYLHSDIDQEIFRKVGVICKNTSRINLLESVDRIRAEHEVYASMLSKNTNLLFEWMIFRLTNEGSWSGPLKPSTAINRLTLLNRAFTKHDRFGDIMLMAPDEVAKLYENMLEDCPTDKLQQSLAKALRDFHDFLYRNYDVELDFTSDKYVLRGAKNNKALSVDAEVLMPWEYRNLKTYLTEISRSPQNQELAQLVLVALILGYRTGMRRSEIQYLRVNDFYLLDDNRTSAEVIVSEHNLRSLKSPAAYRRLKIGSLLTALELEVIYDLVNTRKNRDGSSAFLFRSSTCERPFISARKLFDPLSQLLKQVTGNILMRLHNLRHSAPTWNLYRFMAPSSGKHLAIPKLTELADFQKIADERKAILGVKTGFEPSRKTLHALSMMMGHAHPTTTLRHYIHSSHIVLHDQLCLIQPKLQKKVLADLVGYSHKGLFKSSQRQILDESIDESDEFKAWSIRDKCLSMLGALQDDPLQFNGWKEKRPLHLTWNYREPSAERLELIDYYMATRDYLDGADNIKWLENRYAIFGTKLSLVINRADKLLNLKINIRKGNGSVERQRHWLKCESEYEGSLTSNPEFEKQLPKLSRQIRERVTIEQMLVAVSSLNQTQKDKLSKALEFFANNYQQPDRSIVFSKRRQIDAFVSAIRTLNLTSVAKNGTLAERLRLTICVPQAMRSDEQTQRLEDYWNKAIKFKNYQLDFRNKQVGSQYQNSLAIIDLMSVEAKTSEKKSSMRRVADAGFLVGLYILYVTQPIWNSSSSIYRN